LSLAYNDERARQAFEAAVVEAQEAAPAVVKNAVNPHTQSRYANLEAIARAMQPVMGRAGLRLSFSEGKPEAPGCMRIVGELGHRLGHVREYWIDLPLDGVGSKGNSNMSPVHAKGSTFSYGSRYLLTKIFNIPIVAEDNDGNAKEAKSGAYVTAEDVAMLRRHIKGAKVEEARVVAWLQTRDGNIKELAHLLQSEITMVMDHLREIAKAQRGGA
jgi:hypothetical protein